MVKLSERPAVSIVMASYGRLPLLKESVGSALSQEYPDYEVLVVDDGSDEATREWLGAAQEQHHGLRVVFQDHQGVAAARARGVADARGNLVCILDSDDTLVPHALRRLTEEFEAHPETVLVYTGITESRPNGLRQVHKYPVFPTARGMLWATLLNPRVPFKHSGTTFRRSVAVELGSYDRSLPCKVDIDLYLRFLSAGYLPRLVSEPLVDFRMHKDSVSRKRLLGLRVWFRLIDRYAPPNPIFSAALKALRTVSETAKWLYVELTGWRKR
jgi:glycosyltransferase involved in cell wall biosynthesis